MDLTLPQKLAFSETRRSALRSEYAYIEKIHGVPLGTLRSIERQAGVKLR
jgi:hypothetical protein